ncbi:FitA-like ribbon-helix-helix domain-containing protein [Methylobrevis albus]|uniref:Plasmid stabilization protein n=1 Tax=Methylobrevis albus TaxID=2793297 RepID=A0A931I3U7_9HYPH|nr:plasmid stabilization protein [Methylobrevis albus]MBH0239367.1 plasmid stabilization protein [Methylobrevis albus]
MASIVIEDIDKQLAQRLRERAAAKGRSVEDEALSILRQALAGDAPAPVDIGRSIHARFAALGGIDLAMPLREPVRDPGDWS